MLRIYWFNNTIGMDISLILVIVGILGLLLLFFFKSWQVKAEKDMTSSISASLEKRAQAGAKRTSEKMKNHMKRIKRKAMDSRGKIEVKKLVENNSVSDLIRGRKKIENNGNSSSDFLNNVSEVKKDMRNNPEKEDNSQNN